MNDLTGKMVEWTSHGGGGRTTKRGVVLVDDEGRRTRRDTNLTAFTDLPQEVEEAYFGNCLGRVKFNPGESWRDGLIVKVVPRPDEDEGPGNRPMYYAPRRSLVRAVPEGQ